MTAASAVIAGSSPVRQLLSNHENPPLSFSLSLSLYHLPPPSILHPSSLLPPRTVHPSATVHYALSSMTAGFMTELGFIGENCELWVVELLFAAFMSVTSRFSGSMKKA